MIKSLLAMQGSISAHHHECLDDPCHEHYVTLDIADALSINDNLHTLFLLLEAITYLAVNERCLILYAKRSTPPVFAYVPLDDDGPDPYCIDKWYSTVEEAILETYKECKTVK